MQLTTPRLMMRPWREGDLAAWAAMQADPQVKRYYYPSILTRAQSDAMVASCRAHLARYGFGFLAVERRSDGALIGGAGLSWTHDVPDGPAVEIGWMLGRQFWRQGYASEASRAWFAHGRDIGLKEIVGYTSAINLPSRAVMEKLGMTRGEDFFDPTVPRDDPLAPHVLYRIAVTT